MERRVDGLDEAVARKMLLLEMENEHLRRRIMKLRRSNVAESAVRAQRAWMLALVVIAVLVVALALSAAPWGVKVALALAALTAVGTGTWLVAGTSTTPARTDLRAVLTGTALDLVPLSTSSSGERALDTPVMGTRRNNRLAPPTAASPVSQ